MTRVEWHPEAFRGLVLRAVGVGLDAAGSTLQKDMTLIIGRTHGWVASKPGQPPNSQTNRLRSSIRYARVAPTSVRVGTNVAYGRHLEFGADIQPKSGKRLAIPLSKEAKRLTAMGSKPRNIILAAKLDKSRPLRYIPTKGGDTLIIRDWARTGWSRSSRGAWSRKGGYNANKRGEPFFLLARAAKLRPRPWMRPSLERSKGKMLSEFIRFSASAMGSSQ